MKMTEDNEGNRSSLCVDGFNEFLWAPHKNVIIHTSFPEGDNVYPRISFVEMPSRRLLGMHSAKNSTDLKLYLHPQGSYVAAMNEFIIKKSSKFSVELFETKTFNQGSIPHQQILINREV